MLISIKPTHKTGLKFDLEVPPGTTVAEMKDMIEAAEGISYDYQRYIFKGKLLRSDQTLEECGVQDEDTLHLVLQVMPLGDNVSDVERAPESRWVPPRFAHPELIRPILMAGPGRLAEQLHPCPVPRPRCSGRVYRRQDHGLVPQRPG